MAAAGRAHCEMFFKWIVMFCFGGSCCSETGTKSAVPFVRLFLKRQIPPTDFSRGIAFFPPSNFFSLSVVVVVVVINGTSSRRRAASFCCVRVALFGISILSWTFVSLFSFCLIKFG